MNGVSHVWSFHLNARTKAQQQERESRLAFSAQLVPGGEGQEPGTLAGIYLIAQGHITQRGRKAAGLRSRVLRELEVAQAEDSRLSPAGCAYLFALRNLKHLTAASEISVSRNLTPF